MRERSRPDRDESGIALIATLIVLVLLAALTAAIAFSTVTSVRATGAAYHESRAFYAAEAGAEHAAPVALKLSASSEKRAPPARRVGPRDPKPAGTL